MENTLVSNKAINTFIVVTMIAGGVLTITNLVRYFEDREHNKRTRNISKMQEELLEFQLSQLKNNRI